MYWWSCFRPSSRNIGRHLVSGAAPKESKAMPIVCGETRTETADNTSCDTVWSCPPNCKY
eukprot:3956783-Amphidinium_carterae.1